MQPPSESDPTFRPADDDTSPLPDTDPPPTPGELARPVAGGQPDGARLANFTLALPLRERRVLVVGGGDSATRMVTTLRASGALVRVVAPTLSPQLTELAARGLIEVASRQYQARDLADAWLAFACADHRSVNAALAFDAEQARVWCVVPEDAARPPPAAASAGRRALVLGGSRSGKSVAAAAMLADCAAVDYVATGHLPGHDDPRRPDHWRTVETLDLASVLAQPEPSVAVLIDCVATWLSQVIDECGPWPGHDDADRQGEAGKRLAARQHELVQAWAATPRRVVAVSNEVGSGVVPGTESGRRFRDELGWLNSRLAAEADEVWLCTAGIPTRLR